MATTTTKKGTDARLYFVFVCFLSFFLISFLINISYTNSDPTSHEHHKKVILQEFQRPQSSSFSSNATETNSHFKGYRPVIGQRRQSEYVPDVPYFMVFSTSCSDQQNWESYVFFYHAMKVKQPGSVTRIVSGCNEQEEADLKAFFETHIQPMNNEFHIHFTPHFGQAEDHTGKVVHYKYMNKPFGLRHYMEHVLKMNSPEEKDPNVDDGIIFLLDPDMVLLRPLIHDFTQEDVVFVEENPMTRVVRHGYPMSQQDGYMGTKWMHINVTNVTDEVLPKSVTHQSAPIHWNTGPPYLFTVKDGWSLANLWCQYGPRVHAIHPKMFAEMYGFIFASVKLNMPFTMVKSLVVSTTKSSDREGWQPYIDSLPNGEACNPPDSASLPVGLHYCGRYAVDRWFFSKYRLKKKFISCELPLLELPPKDLAEQKIDYFLVPPPNGHKGEWKEKIEKISSERIMKRETFMLCGMIRAVNEAARYFKANGCPDGKANLAETYTVHNDPNNY